ncbi:MerR family transcriptional regulator [Denitromonas iodatirespirans]|uniref:MerR family transcriptional regulator n=1 Tax=Denitromonas iodatirespirans TaxID=2795389 RepID=A0A944HEN0_DENI1|nr:MerR family transcriptional regulator [Denitromonas iodatirespirans]MBT0963026.1 MerR family transcriptional regulator [Denitromonas iodatirespirans]
MAKRLVTAGEAQKLTGLTTDQLREWTNRRGLIKPDVQPNGPGSRARYAWQTVLLLRLAVVFKETFHIELQAQRDLFAALAQRLEKRPFHALRGSALVLQAGAQYDIVPLPEIRTVDTDSLIIRLDPHLDALSTDFGFVEPTGQLPLFAAMAVR